MEVHRPIESVGEPCHGRCCTFGRKNLSLTGLTTTGATNTFGSSGSGPDRGSGQEVFKMSQAGSGAGVFRDITDRVRSGRVTLIRPDPTRPDPTREI